MDAKLLAGVQEYEAAPSEAASYGVNTFWDGRYAEDLEVSTYAATAAVNPWSFFTRLPSACIIRYAAVPVLYWHTCGTWWYLVVPGGTGIRYQVMRSR